MRAIGVTAYGGPEALEPVTLPDPEPGPGEVLVRVHAAAVSPTDTYVRNGARREWQAKDDPPYVPGMDAAGTVEAIGAQADTDLAVGDAVMALVVPDGAHGAYAQLLALPAGSVVRVPRGTTHAEAATLPMNAMTARLSLDALALAPGDTLAVTGAAGVLGGYVIQLAKHAALRVVADAAEHDRRLVAALGADEIVARGDDVAERILGVAPGGVDGLVDGSVQNAALFPAVRDGGGMVSVRGFTAETPRGIRLHQVWVHRAATDRARLDGLRTLAEEGVLVPRVAETLPAQQAPAAHARLEQGGVRGRLVLDMTTLEA